MFDFMLRECVFSISLSDSHHTLLQHKTQILWPISAPPQALDRRDIKSSFYVTKICSERQNARREFQNSEHA